MRLKKYLLPFLMTVLLLPGSLFACLNEYFPAEMPLKDDKVDLSLLLDGPNKGTRPYWAHGFNSDAGMLVRMDSLKRAGIHKLDYKTLSDYAVMRLKAGNTEEAIRLLEQLFTQHPNEYNILANLGTAYELAGENEKAMVLLLKAVAINPGAHHGSEWIHVKILEQKTSNGPYNKIIDLGIQDFSQWIIDKQYALPRPADSLIRQLAYQLHERIGFVAPPDSIVGQLVLDFADIVAKSESRDTSIAFYDYAARYAPTLQATVQARKEALKAEKKEVQRTFGYASIIWAIPLIAFFLILLAWLRTMRKQKSEAGGQK